MDWKSLYFTFGIAFLLIGIALILIPIIIKFIPNINLENIPWFLLYVYEKDGFFFATSPVLILIGLIYLIFTLLFG